MARKKAKAARQPKAKKTKKKTIEKPKTEIASTALERKYFRSDLNYIDIMSQVNDLVQAVAMNGGITGDTASRLGNIELSLQEAFDKFNRM